MVSLPSGGTIPWAPPTDDELTWVRHDGPLPTHPRPLEFDLAVEAFRYGMGHALDSLYFPYFEVRRRLVDGQLYLAPVPSALGEGDLGRRLIRMRDATVRFSRHLRASWERAIRAEVEEDNDRMAAFALADAPAADAPARLFELKRIRANQWFAALRAVFGPAAMLQADNGGAMPADAAAIVQDARALVLDQGTAQFDAALERVAARLVAAGVLDAPDQIMWLSYAEVQDALAHGTRLQRLVTQRAATPASDTPSPALVGPPLPADSPRLYLFREILDLLR